MPWPQPINFSTAQRFLCLSPFTRHFFLTNNHTPRDTIPRTRLAVAQARGPTGPHFVVAKVKPGSRTRNRKADRIKNITALMMNELGSIRLPPGISRLLFSTAYLLNIFFGPASTIQRLNCSRHRRLNVKGLDLTPDSYPRFAEKLANYQAR